LHIEFEASEQGQFENQSLKVFLFRAVQELLFNIVKHAGVKNARVTLSSSNHHLAVTVSDPGRGFDPMILDTDTKKAGLGLPSLRERARYIGGDLLVESSPGKGSRFTITVPLDLSGAPGAQKAWPEVRQPAIALTEPAAAAASSGIRVLFADDHKVMRQGLVRLVADKPDIHVAGEATNGRETVELARRLKPDVIVMDISMPEMDGIQATRLIKAELPQVRIIGLSMHADEYLAQAMRDVGADLLVSKTASSSQLLKAIYGIESPARAAEETQGLD
jgi:CheY-like chemotaxis protein